MVSHHALSAYKVYLQGGTIIYYPHHRNKTVDGKINILYPFIGQIERFYDGQIN
jgi:hypothetical protein